MTAPAAPAPLRVLYATAMAVSAGCVFLALVLSVQGVTAGGMDQGAVMLLLSRILFVWMLPGTLALFGAGLFLFRSQTPPVWFRFLAIAAAIWTAYVTWSLMF